MSPPTAGENRARNSVTQPIPAIEHVPDNNVFEACPNDNGEPDVLRPIPGSRRFRRFTCVVLLVLGLGVGIRTFVLQVFFIPTSSMENTLKVGDRVLVNKVVFHFRSFQRGDIVVFDGAGSWEPLVPASQPSPNPVIRVYDATIGRLLRPIAELFGTVPEPTDFIKRVIGVPGDRVACCNAQGLLTVNGAPLDEQSYLYPGDSPSAAPPGEPQHFRITVPPGHLWVMGDNRGASDDSRSHQGDPGSGTIPENKVVGRAFFIAWPPSRWRIISNPAFFAAGLGA